MVDQVWNSVIAELQKGVEEKSHPFKFATLATLGLERPGAFLGEAGVVLDRRQGQWIYYRLNPGLPDWAQRVLEATAAGIAGQRSFAADKRALSRMPNRPGKACCA